MSSRPPRHSGGEDDRSRLDGVASVEADRAGDRIDVLCEPRHVDLRAQPFCLLEGSMSQLATGNAEREAKIILDARRGARLSARSFALDEHRR
jgi:hypothetical protein